MKVAVVYNYRRSGQVINLFGEEVQEKIGRRTIEQIVSALKTGGHQVKEIEADKNLAKKLEDYLPPALRGEIPGLVFNVSYGRQGEAAYTHVPAVLEMVGIPYIGSGPSAQSLCLDKVVTKVILQNDGLLTPEFHLLRAPDEDVPELTYPRVVKPIAEASSFGIEVVYDEAEMRAAAKVLFDRSDQPVLVEQFIDGPEVNVGLLGNNPPDAFPPVLIDGFDKIYSHEDKVRASDRDITLDCPAFKGDDAPFNAAAQEVAKRAFIVLGCRDFARVDMRFDEAEGEFYILEVNSLASLGPNSSYPKGAEHFGLDFSQCINRMVEVAHARYDRTSSSGGADDGTTDRNTEIVQFVAKSRRSMLDQLSAWVGHQTRSDDPVGLKKGFDKLSRIFGDDLGMRKVGELSRAGDIATWQTEAGFADGVLLIGQLDVWFHQELPAQNYRRETLWLYGEGIGVSRAPLVMLEYALRALGSRLQRIPLGVLYYADDRHAAHYSEEKIRRAAERAKEVLILQPGQPPNKIVTQRHGRREFQLRIETGQTWMGVAEAEPDALRLMCRTLDELAALSSQDKQTTLAALDIRTDRYPLRLPHRVTAQVAETYLTPTRSDAIERGMRNLLGDELVHESTRPPFVERAAGKDLAEELKGLAVDLGINELQARPGVGPSVAGLVPSDKACVCGIGPVAENLHTVRERVKRATLVERTQLLAEFLSRRVPNKKGP